MNIDTFIAKSNAHKHCEDYLLGGFVKNTPFGIGIVSDGCSSGTMTDVGSRIMVTAAKKVLLDYDIEDLKKEIESNRTEQMNEISNQSHFELPPYMVKIIESADRVKKELALPEDSLEATLIFFIFDYERVDPTVDIVIYGDGAVVWKLKEAKDYEAIIVEFTENMPFYPAIYLSKDRVADFNKYHKNEQITRNAKRVKYLYFNEVETTTNITDYHHSYPLFFRLDLADVEFLMIATDGVEALKKKDKEYLEPTENVLREIVNFKTYAGKFLERKMQNKMMKEYEPMDDISIVAFHNPSNIII